MYSKIKIMGHPVHPMIVSFPIVFYTSTLLAFIIYAISGNPFWFRVGITANIAGIATAVLAALFGFLDWYLGIPRGSAPSRVGMKHMGLNSFSLVLFIITFALNVGEWGAVTPIMRGAIILPLIGFIATLMAGYYGWTLVQHHHVGVEFSREEESCLRETGGRYRRTA